jgi:trehalose/maltose hydrolase-like predicted phosphorylase
MVAVKGFAGLQLLQDEVRLSPQLPAQWNALRFSFSWQGQRASVSLRAGHACVSADSANTRPIPIRSADQKMDLYPSQSVDL